MRQSADEGSLAESRSGDRIDALNAYRKANDPGPLERSLHLVRHIGVHDLSGRRGQQDPEAIRLLDNLPSCHGDRFEDVVEDVGMDGDACKVEQVFLASFDRVKQRERTAIWANISRMQMGSTSS